MSSLASGKAEYFIYATSTCPILPHMFNRALLESLLNTWIMHTIVLIHEPIIPSNQWIGNTQTKLYRVIFEAKINTYIEVKEMQAPIQAFSIITTSLRYSHYVASSSTIWQRWSKGHFQEPPPKNDYLKPWSPSHQKGVHQQLPQHQERTLLMLHPSPKWWKTWGIAARFRIYMQKTLITPRKIDYNKYNSWTLSMDS